MADSNDNPPHYLASLPAPTDEVLWQQISDRFDDLVIFLRTVKLEKKEQAIPQRHGMKVIDRGVYWHDPDIGVEVKPWLQIPFDPDRDLEYFTEVWRLALVLSEPLKSQIAARSLSVQTLSNWGTFYQYASILEREFLRQPPDVRHLKGGASQSLDQHKIWFSHLFMSLKKKGDKRSDTEFRVLERLHELMEKECPDPLFPKEWFVEILSEEQEDFAASFKENKLSLKKIKHFANEPRNGLPPLDF